MISLAYSTLINKRYPDTWKLILKSQYDRIAKRLSIHIRQVILVCTENSRTSHLVYLPNIGLW